MKLEWTPGPRLALIAFLSMSPRCIRVTFPLCFSLLYIYLFYFLSCPNVSSCQSRHRGDYNSTSRSKNTPHGVFHRRRDVSASVNCAQNPKIPRTHLWLDFTFRQCITELPLFVRLLHYLPPPLLHPPGRLNAIYHPRETLCLPQLQNLMNK